METEAAALHSAGETEAEAEAEAEADLHPALSWRPRPRSHEITCQECARGVCI